MMHMMPKGERTITLVHMGHVDTTFLRAKPIIVAYMWCKISISALRETFFVKNPSEFDKQKGFSTEQCVVDYKNVNCLDKQNGFCIVAAAKYCISLSAIWCHHSDCMFVCMCICVCMHLYVYVCICMCVCVYMCMYVYVCVCMLRVG